MTPALFYIVAASLLLLRLAAQWWARGPAPAAPARGRASVVLWFVTYVALLAGAVAEVHRSGSAAWSGVALFSASLALRFAGLHALQGHYREAIAVHEEQGVVRSGVYRFLRHPLHLALLGESCALAVLWGRWFGLPLVIVMLLVLLQRNGEEEAVLRDGLGAPYRDYCESGAWDLIDLLPGRRARGESA